MKFKSLRQRKAVMGKISFKMNDKNMYQPSKSITSNLPTPLTPSKANNDVKKSFNKYSNMYKGKLK